MSEATTNTRVHILHTKKPGYIEKEKNFTSTLVQTKRQKIMNNIIVFVMLKVTKNISDETDLYYIFNIHTKGLLS